MSAPTHLLAQLILDYTSETSPTVRRDVLRSAYGRTRPGRDPRKTAEWVRRALRELRDPGWIDVFKNHAGISLVSVTNRDALRSWLSDGQAYPDTKRSSQHEGRACRDKYRHTAETAPKAASKLGGTYYECPWCGHFHVTSGGQQ